MIPRNTARTLLRFVGTLLSKYTGLRFGGDRLEDIFNFVVINQRVSTSGQPTAQQFAAIQAAGFETIVNLLPADTENALKNEAQIVRELGLDYVYIPVNFKGPTEEDFATFCAAMEQHNERKVWVHCAVNARVSVFVARYRREVVGEPAEMAERPIAQVWEPFGVWKAFSKRGPPQPAEDVSSGAEV